MEYFGTDLDNYGHYRFDISNNKFEKKWLDFKDLPFHPEHLTNKIKDGDYAFYKGGGFTVMAFPGSCKDSRPGSKTVFWVKENITESEMFLRLSQNLIAIRIMAAMPYKTIFYD